MFLCFYPYPPAAPVVGILPRGWARGVSVVQDLVFRGVVPSRLQWATSCPPPPLLDVQQSLDSVSRALNLDARRIRACARRRANLTLDSCQNLAPAGTGTKSLKRALENATARHWKHYHWMRLVPKKPSPCILMTLRDPAERLESAFRYELNSSNKHASPTSPFTLRGIATSAAAFVDAMRNETHPKHKRALGLYRRSAYLPSLFTGDWTPASMDLDNFLVSTVNYLRGLDCDQSELHFICTNAFDSQWRAVLLSFGHNASTTAPHLNARSAMVTSSVATASRLTSPADVEYVRRTLYPWDTILFEAACGSLAPRQRNPDSERAAVLR